MLHKVFYILYEGYKYNEIFEWVGVFLFFQTLFSSLIMHSDIHIATPVPIVMSLEMSLPIVMPQWSILSNLVTHCDVIMSHGT